MNTPSNFGASGSDRNVPKAGAAVRQLLPLTVWLCSDTTDEKDSKVCRQHRRHRRAVGRQLSRHLITACTHEGDLVAEAFTTSEATLMAAAELGRAGVACVPHLPLAQHIGNQLRASLPADALTNLAMRPCRPDQMHRGMADHLGQVSLVIAAPPPYELGGRAGKHLESKDCPICRADLRMLGEQQLAAFLAAAWRVLRRGGALAVITSARHQGGRLVDPAPQVIRQCAALGFRYSQHVIALRVPVQGDSLVVQADAADMAQLRDVRSRALPPAVSLHADVSLFLKPQTVVQGAGR